MFWYNNHFWIKFRSVAFPDIFLKLFQVRNQLTADSVPLGNNEQKHYKLSQSGSHNFALNRREIRKKIPFVSANQNLVIILENHVKVSILLI